MITIESQWQNSYPFVLVPTMFPDGTSQVWKLPDSLLNAKKLYIKWNFESEREILDLLSLRKLLSGTTHDWFLYIPFLPYARQDKMVSNNTTFNLSVIADLINSLGCVEVSSVDVHNLAYTREVIDNFLPYYPYQFHRMVVDQSLPDYLVFPDLGARNRYATYLSAQPSIVCYKERDPSSGKIVRHDMSLRTPGGMGIHFPNLASIVDPGSKFLIVDDICDGGATFISIAKMLREQVLCPVIELCVTHGIFSKGRDHLLNRGINKIYTTNSLIKNREDYKV